VDGFFVSFKWLERFARLVYEKQYDDGRVTGREMPASSGSCFMTVSPNPGA
jgi:hypothetical protein